MSAPVHHDIEAERAVLASVFLDPSSLDEVGDLLTPDDFYSRAHALVYDAMRSLAARGETVDLVMVRSELRSKRVFDRAGGDRGLMRLTDELPSPNAVEDYARRVRGWATVRAMVNAALTVASSAREPIESVDEFLDRAEAGLHEVAQMRRTDRRGSSMREVVISVAEAVTKRAERQGIQGLRTCLPALDRMLGGMKPSQLIIVAGRPGMGKSAFAGCVARKVSDGVPVAVFSCEMGADEWGERLAVSESGVDGDAVRTGTMSRSQWADFTSAMGKLANLPIHIDDTPSLSLWQLRSKARRLQAREGLGLIVVDYLQLMTSGTGERDREKEVAAVSRGLKAIAKELRVPVMALAQLNRRAEDGSDKRPTMAHLRESGQIEQDADAILFLFRPHLYNPEEARPTDAEVIVAKQRSGPTGTVQCRFVRELFRFEPAPDAYDDVPGWDAAPLPDAEFGDP